MSNFDYRLHKVIGVARKKYEGAPHASIYPLGYQDRNFHFHPFNKKEVKDLFLHNGTVFGYKFLDYLVDELIILQVRENEIVDDPTKDVFSADYVTKITKYDHTPVFSATKQELRDAVNQGKNNNYFKVGERIYQITKSEAQKGIVKYWTIEDGLFEANRNLCMCDDDVFIIRDDIVYPYNYEELWNKKEIINFVINLIKTFKIDTQNITAISDELIQEIGLPLDILKFRLDEFNLLLPSITLTHKNILDLAANPILSDVLQRSIKEYEDEYIKTYEEHHRELLKKIEQSKEQKLKDISKEYQEEHKIHLSQLKAITDKIEKANVRLSEINGEIKKKETEAKVLELRFADIEEHKDRLIEDFTVIKDVIGGQAHTPQQSPKNCIQRVNCKGESISEFKEFRNHIFTHLLNNRFQEDSAKEIAKELSILFFAQNHIGKNKSVILLPNLKIFKSLIDAVGQYRLCSIGVAPNWKSYDDLYHNGFGEMIISARNNPEEIHFVLLQNMNLSYIPSYMRPINDILIGISNKLPEDNDCTGIPSNLWIFGTRTGLNEEAIPISLPSIEEYGCIKNKEYTYSKDIKTEPLKCKFITMDFVNIQRDEEYLYDELPDSYID